MDFPDRARESFSAGGNAHVRKSPESAQKPFFARERIDRHDFDDIFLAYGAGRMPEKKIVTGSDETKRVSPPRPQLIAEEKKVLRKTIPVKAVECPHLSLGLVDPCAGMMPPGDERNLADAPEPVFLFKPRKKIAVRLDRDESESIFLRQFRENPVKDMSLREIKKVRSSFRNFRREEIRVDESTRAPVSGDVDPG